MDCIAGRSKGLQYPQHTFGMEAHSFLACREEMDDLAGMVGLDAGRVVRQALLNKAAREAKFKLPGVVKPLKHIQTNIRLVCTALSAGTACLSLVLCDDPYIRALNLQHRNKDTPTDVLSFEMEDELSYKASTRMQHSW
jgi:hypothetical protein